MLHIFGNKAFLIHQSWIPTIHTHREAFALQGFGQLRHCLPRRNQFRVKHLNNNPQCGAHARVIVSQRDRRSKGKKPLGALLFGGCALLGLSSGQSSRAASIPVRKPLPGTFFFLPIRSAGFRLRRRASSPSGPRHDLHIRYP